MTSTRKNTAKHGMLTALIALALGMGSLMASSPANAQAVSVPPSASVPPPSFTPPPTKIPPPVVSVTPPRLDRPMTGMNTPSDMRTLTQLDGIGSVDRLLTSPSVVNLTIPRQAQPNKLENRLPQPAGAAAGTGKDDRGALQALEGAKPLI